MKYKREHVMLFYPFDREVEILDSNKFLEIFDEHYVTVMNEKKKCTHIIDFQELFRICETILEFEAHLRDGAQHGEESSLPSGASPMVRLAETVDNGGICKTHMTSQGQLLPDARLFRHGQTFYLQRSSFKK